MIDLTDRDQLLAHLKSRHLWLRKESGQHFLVEQEILTKIITAAELTPSETVVEIGPGVGTLTAALSDIVTNGLVLAIEKDPRLVATLRDDFKSRRNVKIVHEDGVRFVTDFQKSHTTPWKLVSNLPYNISGSILRQLLGSESGEMPASRIVLMLQKEVVGRLLAAPGESGRGILTIVREVGWDAELVAMVAKTAFFPVPEVESAVIMLTPVKSALPIATQRQILHLAKLGFAAKRRTIENTLSAGLHMAKQMVAEQLIALGIEPRLRAEDLTLANWQTLADKLALTGKTTD